MNYEKDPLISNVLDTIYLIGSIVLAVLLRKKGIIFDVNIVIYIISCIVIIVLNAITYLPLYVGVFVLLKLLGKLTLGWWWIVVAVIIDLLMGAFCVQDNRSIPGQRY